MLCIPLLPYEPRPLEKREHLIDCGTPLNLQSELAVKFLLCLENLCFFSFPECYKFPPPKKKTAECYKFLIDPKKNYSFYEDGLRVLQCY